MSQISESASRYLSSLKSIPQKEKGRIDYDESMKVIEPTFQPGNTISDKRKQELIKLAKRLSPSQKRLLKEKFAKIEGRDFSKKQTQDLSRTDAMEQLKANQIRAMRIAEQKQQNAIKEAEAKEQARIAKEQEAEKAKLEKQQKAEKAKLDKPIKIDSYLNSIDNFDDDIAELQKSLNELEEDYENARERYQNKPNKTLKSILDQDRVDIQNTQRKINRLTLRRQAQLRRLGDEAYKKAGSQDEFMQILANGGVPQEVIVEILAILKNDYKDN